MSLEIKNLNVKIEGKEIIKDLNLKLEKGKVYALMGPNGSGKSTLAQVLMGNPKYKFEGKIFLDGDDITDLTPGEKAKKGLFLSFQYPVEIPGITISNFLRTAHASNTGKKANVMEFHNILKKQAAKIGMNETFLSRHLNSGFSGGEKKKAEVLQMLVLNPKVAILDETDSGLDVDSLKIVAEGINRFINKGKIVLLITHYKRMLEYVKPDKIFIIKKGEIVKEGGKELIEEIEEKGFEKIK